MSFGAKGGDSTFLIVKHVHLSHNPEGHSDRSVPAPAADPS